MTEGGLRHTVVLISFQHTAAAVEKKREMLCRKQQTGNQKNTQVGGGGLNCLVPFHDFYTLYEMMMVIL